MINRDNFTCERCGAKVHRPGREMACLRISSWHRNSDEDLDLYVATCLRCWSRISPQETMQ